MGFGAVRPVLLAALLSAACFSLASAQQPPLPDLPDPATAIEPPADGEAGGGVAAPDALPAQTIETPPDETPRIGSPILTVDQERLFAESAWGLRAQQVLEDEGRAIAAENERLADQLSDEEADLTSRRAELDPAAFRQLAEAFDAKATAIRRDRAQAVQQLNARADAERSAFFQSALPVMGDLMQQRGAVSVLDRRTVFVSLDAIDITSELIERLDAELGDGSDSLPDERAPDTDPAQDIPAAADGSGGD